MCDIIIKLTWERKTREHNAGNIWCTPIFVDIVCCTLTSVDILCLTSSAFYPQAAIISHFPFSLMDDEAADCIISQERGGQLSLWLRRWVYILKF
jgi:hypothetical protein